MRIDCGQTIIFHFSVSEMNAFRTSGKNIVAEETLHLNCLPKKQSNLNSSNPHPCLILASNHHPLLTSQKIPPPKKKYSILSSTYFNLIKYVLKPPPCNQGKKKTKICKILFKQALYFDPPTLTARLSS